MFRVRVREQLPRFSTCRLWGLKSTYDGDARRLS